METKKQEGIQIKTSSKPEIKKANKITPNKMSDNQKTPTSCNANETQKLTESPNLYDLFSTKPEPGLCKKLVCITPDKFDFKPNIPNNEQKKVEYIPLKPDENLKTPLVTQKAITTSSTKAVPISSSTPNNENDSKIKNISLSSSEKPHVQVPSSVALFSPTVSDKNTSVKPDKAELKSVTVSGSTSTTEQTDTTFVDSKEKYTIVTKPSQSKPNTPVPKSYTNPSKPLDTKTSLATLTPKPLSASQPQSKPFVFPASTTPKMPPAKHVSSYSSTAQLNQKFKKAPLSLPTSLFAHVPDFARNDIKITSTVAQKSSTVAHNPSVNKERDSVKKTEQEVKKQPTAVCKPEASKKLQDELDSYYKLISTEDDPEDLTTSEDQDMAMEEATVTPTLVQIVEAPAKKVVSEISKPTVLPVAQALSATEEVDDSDMACEDAPEAPDTSSWPSSSVPSTVYGHGFFSSSYGAHKAPVTADKYSPKPLYATGQLDQVSSNKGPGQGALPVADYTMEEDLSVLTTCDESD